MTDSPDETPSVTMSLPDAARLLGVSESLARQLARRRQFPGAFKLSARVLVHRQVFLEELERLGRGHPLAEDDPDRVLARAMSDARARLAALPRGAPSRHESVGRGA
ncbi:MAG TPA: helix-turn-helix domain-containing protein [Candidatus Binatia bacterium]|nr:helix-turn-helix domain-containing protein [Candidatus Binatia bacterium]